ncbi:MAG TPA: hypothetical protein VGJ05_18040 [Fimbriiglobus sp.]|jgi:hypothetical protein
MVHGTRGWVAALILTAGSVGCNLPGKRTRPETIQPLTVAPPRPVTPAATPLQVNTPAANRNGTMNVPATPTSGGTLRPEPANPPTVDPPVLPTVPANPTPKPDTGTALPPAPNGLMVDPKNISPPTPAKLDLPSLPN